MNFMAKFLMTLVAVILLTGCSGVLQKDFSVNLYLKAEENSEDSNSQTETLELNGTRGEYTWTYGGTRMESFTLSEEEVESLKLFLKDKALNVDLVEEKPMDEMGNTVDMKLEIEIEGEKSEIVVRGMSAIYGNGSGESNLENFDTVEAAQDLIYTVKDLGGLYEE